MRARGEGTITQRRDGLWQSGITLPNGKRRWFYGRTQREALEKMRAAQRLLAQGQALDAGKQTAALFFTEWLETVARDRLRASSFQSYRHLLMSFAVPAFGGKRLDRVTPQDLVALYAARRRAGAAGASVLLLHAVIRRAFRDAVRWGLLAVNPATLVDAPAQTRREPTALTPQQARRFLAASVETRFHALWVLALTTGMRRGELLGLKWADVDLGRAVAHVQRTMSRGERGWVEADTKTRSARRSIRLLPVAVSALRMWRRIRDEMEAFGGTAWQERDLVFCTSTGGPLNPSHLVKRHFEPLLAAAGCPRVRFHDLRHSAASLLASLDVPAKVVQEILGHANISMTMDVYTHLFAGAHFDAVERLGKLLGLGEQ